MRMPFDGNYPITATFADHLASSDAIVRGSAGVDWGMKVGVPLFAVENGTVSPLLTDQFGGLYVKLTSKDGRRVWTYRHLSRAGHTGDVDTGMHVGFSGSSGYASGAHLHLDVKEGGVLRDPLKIIGSSDKTEELLRDILTVQRPDVIKAGVPLIDWWYGSGVYEIIAQLKKLKRNDVLNAANSVTDTGYWLLNWYITSGFKEYPKSPYIWGAKPVVTPPPDPCKEAVDKEKEACKALVADTINECEEQCAEKIVALNEAHQNELADLEDEKRKYQALYQKCKNELDGCDEEKSILKKVVEWLVELIKTLVESVTSKFQQ